MKTLILQSFTVMAILLMVYGHPTPEKERLRRQIHERAQKLNHTTLPRITVPHRHPGQELCVKEFFCLAEKSLNYTLNKISNNEIHKDLEILKRAVHQYNNKTNHISCQLNMKQECLLQRLVIDILNCSK
ncbi:uncharacterized protein LOC101070453 [Lates japonicus]